MDELSETGGDAAAAAEWEAGPAARSVPGAALVGKALQLVDLVGAEALPVSGADLARRTGWARPTLYRILSAVVAHDYLRADPASGGYTLGFRFLEHAQRAWSGTGLVAAASVELQRLRDMTGETAYLAVPHDGAMLGLGKFEGLHAVRSSARLGAAKPVHCTSQGKAVLAFLPEPEARRLLTQGPLKRLTPNTITDPAALIGQLGVIRQRGFATEDEEIKLGNRCVGAAVLDAAGRPVAAISVAAPTWRLTPERVDQLGPEIAAVARSIGMRLDRGVPAIPPAAGGVVPHPSGETAFHGGDPAWDARGRLLRWTDRLAPCIHETPDEASGRPARIVRLPIEARIEAASLGSAGVVSLGGRLLRQKGSDWSDAAWPPSCGAVAAVAQGPDGRIWAATPAAGGGTAIRDLAEPAQPRWTLGATVAALAACPASGALYAADPSRHAVYVLGAGRAPRLLTRLPAVSGEPRGLAVDAGGRVWIALDGGWCVSRLNADGEVDRVMALPVPRPTGLAFGGVDGGTLYVTTARIGLGREVLEKAPLSGRLLLTRI